MGKFSAIRAFIKDNKHAGLIISVLLFVFICAVTFTRFYDIFELKLYDLRFGLKKPVKQWERLVFVNIDEDSLSALGEFPWPRDKYGDAFTSLSQINSFMLGLDIMFPDKSPKYLSQAAYDDILAKASGGSALAPADIRRVAKNNDEHFAENCAAFGRGILAYTFALDEANAQTLAKRSSPDFSSAYAEFLAKSSIKIPEKRLPEFKGLEDDKVKDLSPPISEIMRSGKLFGFVNRYTDPDGIIRRVQLVNKWQDRLFFNLAIVMLADVCDVTLDRIEVVPGKHIIFRGALHPVTFEKEDMYIPIDDHGILYVNWASPGPLQKSFASLPFYALIDYAKYSEGVNLYFDQMESQTSRLRSQLYSRLEELKRAFEVESDAKKKRELYAEISKVKKDIVAEKYKYLKIMEEGILSAEKEYERTKDESLLRQIGDWKDDAAAIKLVILAENLEDKICLTGLTAPGTHDIGAIPTHNEYPRVGSYHNTINTIVQGDYIRRISGWVNYLLIFAVCLVIGIIAHKAKPKYSLIFAGASVIAVNAVAVFVFSYFGVWVEELGLNLAVALPSLSIISIKLLNTESQRRFIRGAFSRYLSSDVIEEIMKNPQALQLGGESREITMFFSDVAHFSTMSEKMSPNELVSFLNEYLSEMTDIILSYKGTVDKYEGDAIIAFYGAPHNLPEHPLNACLAAIDMKHKLRDLQDKWKSEGKEELSVRMGINTGMAVVGNMGSKNRMDYTAMGDSVNLASRLEGANKFYSSSVMISGATYERVKDDLECRELDVIRVVGKDQPVPIYELLGRKGSLPQRVYAMHEKYMAGRALFKAKDWAGAKLLFEQALEILPDDGPSKTYVDRCGEYISSPPPKNWDGVYSLKGK